jgi:hypothetical protein
MAAGNHNVVEFWHCLGCGKHYRVPCPMYPLIEAYVPSLATGTKTPNLLCEACSDLRCYTKTDFPLQRTFDIATVARFVLVQRIFLGQIGCAEKSCASPIEILLPRTIHWDLQAVQGLIPVDWKIHPNVLCAAKHPPATPIARCRVQELKS